MHTCNDGREECPIIPYIGPDKSICGEHDAILNRHALRPSKQYWITCPRKLKSEF